MMRRKTFAALKMRIAHNRPAVQILIVVCFVFALAAFYHSSGFWGSSRSVDNNPFADLYRNDTQRQCQETSYQPFLVGCPETCGSYRQEVTADEPMYRLTLEWYFGQVKSKLHPYPSPESNTFYDMGYNYQCPMDFVDTFGYASDVLEATLLQQPFPDLNVKTQSRMHVSLAYLCCLRLEEAYHVREIMEDWIHSTSFLVPDVTFDRIECWKERFNSITHIIVVDNKSQQRLLSLLHQLEAEIKRADIPIPIARQTQMPFHSTLLGVQMGSKYSMDPRHSIDPILPVSFSTLQQIHREHIWPAEGLTFDIHHRPKFSYRPALQAAIESKP